MLRHLARLTCLPLAAAIAMHLYTGAQESAGAQDNYLTSHMPYAAFDRLAHDVVKVDGGRLLLGIAPGALKLPKEKLVAWATRSAEAVSVYFGRFPVNSARVLMVPVGGKGVKNAQAFGYQGSAVRLSIGEYTNERDLAGDWKMVHEMIHLSTPRMASRHDWLTEGIAVYVESIARVQAGHLSAGTIWGEFVRDMPQGLPGFGDRGLDNTVSWGRTYWGGATFCLLADIAIRERTGNEHGLQDVLRAVIDAGGSNETVWTIDRFIAVGDAATGTVVLRELYDQMRERPYLADLDIVWRRLGIVEANGAAAFDETAELAHIRRRLTERPAVQIRG